MTDEKKINIDDILNISLENVPPIEVQEAMVDEIERLVAEGKSQGEAYKLVCGDDPLNYKPQ